MNRLGILLGGALLAGALGLATSLHAQQSFGGTPLALTSAGLRATSAQATVEPMHVALDFNVDDEMGTSAWGNARQGRPLQIGRVINCDLSFARDAKQVGSVQGINIYRMSVSTDGTPTGTILYYKDFFIPQGGKLYIYDADGTTILGAYTHETHPEHGSFATEPLSTGNVIMEYEAPAGVDLPTIEVEGLGYLFRPVFSTQEKGLGYGFDSSDPYLSRACQINVNCPEGDAWQDQKNGIVALVQRFPKPGGFTQSIISACSGNLLNNTEQDFKPYIISAAHCAGEENGSWKGEFKVPESMMNQWIFGFNYERPGCSNGNYAMYNVNTMVGCSIRSYITIYGYSDGMLVELNQPIPDNYRVYYNGFDATPGVPASGVGMHHPAADSKKISVFKGGVTTGTWDSENYNGGTNDHFIFEYASGATEGGSSGSSLFNENKMVVGTLTGGMVSICSGATFYGRLNAHWDKYTSKGDLYHMDKFLDPNGKAKKVEGTWKNGFKPLLNVKNVEAVLDEEGKKVTVTWDKLPAHDQGYTITYRLLRGEQVLGDFAENTYTEDLTPEMIQEGALHYSVVARYQIDESTVTPTAPGYANLYVAPLEEWAPGVFTEETASGINITWDEVVNAQLISKVGFGTKRLAMQKSLDGIISSIPTIWTVDAWRPELFDATNLYLSQINFIPGAAGKKYTLVAFQKGVRPVETAVNVPAGTSTTEYYPALLAKPIKVNPNQALWVGYTMPNSSSNPAMRVVTGSKDGNFETDGNHTILIMPNAGVKEQYMQVQDVTHEDEIADYLDRQGYLALELVFTSSPNALKEPVGRYWVKSTLPAQFPTLKGYKVFKNGEFLADADGRWHNDPDGTAADRYTVQAQYDYPEALDVEKPLLAEKNVYAYPTRFSSELHLNDAALVETVRFYTANGALALEVPAAQTISTRGLAPATYVVVLTTANGNITQKMVKE